MTKLDPRSVRFALSLLLSLILAGCGGGASQSNSGGSPNPSPALSSIAPQRATAGSAAVTLALTGTGFLSTSQVQWNGSALATTYGSATSLTALVPTADLSSVGTASVTVTNPAPGGGTSSAATFTVDPAPNPAPSLSTITPATALAGSSALTLTLTGTGFLPTSQVQWNGSALATTYGSATSLTALVPTADLSSAGTASVTVTNPAPGGGISSAATFTVQAPPNPAPRLSTIAPASVVAGSSGLTLTVTGTGFLPTSQIQWNGSALATNYGSPASLTAQIPSADLLSAGSASVTVSTPAPGGGLSGALTFSIKAMSVNLTVLPIEGRDLSWNASQQKLYVAVPASAASYGSTITVVDPIAGTIGTSRTLASEPSVLAISADDSYLYAAINDGTTIQRLTLPALTPDIQWSLGNNALESAANAAAEIQVQPGAPHTLAVAFGAIGYATDEIALYDDAHLRAPATCTFCDHLQWKPDGSELFASSGASDTALYTFSVNAAGLSPVASYASALLTWTHHLHLDAASGYLYTDLGKVVDPSNGLPIAQYGLSWSSAGPNSLALAIANPATRRYFVLQPVATAGGGSALQIQSYDMDRLTVESTIQIANVPGIPANFITWGQSGLAFVTRATSGQPDGQLYILDGTFVNPSGALDTTAGTALTPLPTLTAVTPLHATIGSGNITVTLTGHDFTETTTAYLNGNSLSTTPLNSTQVQAAIPASALTASTTASLTLSNTTSADAVSNALPFTVDPAPPAGTQISEYDTGGNSLVWDSKAEKIYVSMPANQGSQGNAIATVDPVAGTVATTGFIGSDPAHLVLSSDGPVPGCGPPQSKCPRAVHPARAHAQQEMEPGRRSVLWHPLRQ